MNSDHLNSGVSKQRKEIPKQPRGKYALPSWALLIFCVPFVLVGAAAIAVGLGTISIEEMSGFDAPGWVIVLFGSVFVLIGTLVAVTTFMAERRKAKAKKVPPSIAYQYEHSWSPDGVGDDTGRTILKTLSSFVLLGGFLVPFHGILYYFIFIKKEDGKWIAYIFLGIFDFILLAMILSVIYLLIRRLRFGKTRVRFSDFPYYLGQTMKVDLEGGRKLKNLPRINVTLRCIEEVLERRGSGKNSTAQIICYQLYENKLECHTDVEGRASISFELPENIPGTQLTKNPPTYWELVVDADLPGIDYEGVFLVPVYAP